MLAWRLSNGPCLNFSGAVACNNVGAQTVRPYVYRMYIPRKLFHSALTPVWR